jgi:hypothetical protein
MKRCPENSCRCAVCGRESSEHAGWFLVVENAWLDRVKILSWHPALAEQDQMQSVCGKRHLQILVTHWLTYANLNFVLFRIPEFALTANADATEAKPEPPSAGRLVGELAVHRESLSRLWTGSPEARESIFRALIGDSGLMETPPHVATGQIAEPVPFEPAAAPTLANEFFKQYAYQ